MEKQSKKYILNILKSKLRKEKNNKTENSNQLLPIVTVPSDLIVAIFYYLGPEFRFSSNLLKINNAFYNLAQERRFKPIFNEIIFDTSKGYPYTETIQYAINRMEKADLLNCTGPYLDKYHVSSKYFESHESSIENIFLHKEKNLLKKAAAKFITYINKD